MKMDEILFYGGLTAVGCTMAATAFFWCISRIRLSKLKAALEKEYGEQEKK